MRTSEVLKRSFLQNFTHSLCWTHTLFTQFFCPFLYLSLCLFALFNSRNAGRILMKFGKEFVPFEVKINAGLLTYKIGKKNMADEQTCWSDTSAT
jgi:hypothetical protein